MEACYDAPKFGTHAMLNLPKKWRAYDGGYVAMRLIEKIEKNSVRYDCMGHFVGASLDLVYTTFWSRNNPDRRIETQYPGREWRFGRMEYRFCPKIDDDTLSDCVRARRQGSRVTVIVPPNHLELLRSALKYKHSNRAPRVWAFDNMIAKRELFASMHAKWTRIETMRALFRFYNERVAKTTFSNWLSINIPED